MNISRVRVLPLALSLLALPLASGCIINAGDGDDDDDMADSGGTEGNDPSDDPGNGSEGSGGGSEGSGGGSNGSADETGSPGDADLPAEGTWLYTETGNTTNDCDFLENPSNGWGEYRVEIDGDGFLITPGDSTDPFECSAGGGQFECPERLQDEMSEGTSTLQVYVQVSGDLPSEDEMAGSQDGRIECMGADCALAEQLLGTSFPCSFSIEFTGQRV